MNLRYNIVDTPEKLMALDSVLMDGDKPRFEYLAYDTEANGLLYYRSTLIGFSISVSRSQGYYIPFLKWVPDPASKKKRTKDGVEREVFTDGHLQCVWTGKTYPEFVTPQEYDVKTILPFIPHFLERWLKPTKNKMWNAPYDVNMTRICTGVDLTDSLWLDGSLLVHVCDENYYVRLKDNAEKYREGLGINPHALAAIEKQELVESILRNGGTKAGEVWRADLEYQAKYACADTNLTFGICDLALNEFAERFGQRGLDWFFNKEVMPLCREVVIDMKARGVPIHVPYFEQLAKENETKLAQLEDQVVNYLESQNWLTDFNLGKSIDEEVSNKALVLELMRREGLPVPLKTDKKTGETKESLAKAEVKKAYEKTPHWIYGYLLGEDEIKYSPEVLNQIKLEIYRNKTGKRHRFNINSRDHLTWLFCSKLGFDAKKLPQTDSATKDNPIPSMAAEVLEEFMLPKHAWLATLLSYKKLVKLQSTYILPALELQFNGILYMDMKQNGTTSGRFSCSGGYNLQTLPRVDDEMELLSECNKCGSNEVEIKQDITCMADLHCKKCGHVDKDIPRPSAIKRGFVAKASQKFVNADYASLEPKCFSFVANEDVLKEVYRKGFDFYSQIYCEIFDKEKQYSADPKEPNYLKSVAKAKRQFVKPFCFVEGAVVDTLRGRLGIEDVVVGDFVRTKGGFQKVSKVFSRQVEKTVTLFTNRTFLECTEDHEIFSKTFETWKEAGKFEVGELVEYQVPEKQSVFFTKDLPVFSKGSIKKGFNEKSLFTFQLDETWAWIIGAFLGDGIGSYQKRYDLTSLNVAYIGMCGLPADGIVREFANELNKFGYDGKIKVVEKEGHSPLDYVHYHGFELCSLFERVLGLIHFNEDLGRGEKKLAVPPYILNGSRDIQLAFLAGVIDTDGYSKAGKTFSEVCICSKEKKFIAGLQLILSNFGTIGAFNIQHNKTYNRDYYTLDFGQQAIEALGRVGIQNYIRCDRKKRAFEFRLTKPARPRILKHKVTKITHQNKKRIVYDITVEGEHEFFANNIRVHNCLAVPYGAKAGQVAAMIGATVPVEQEDGTIVQKPDFKRGQEIIDQYLGGLPNLRRYMEEQEEKASSLGYVENLLGRRRHLPLAKHIRTVLAENRVDYQDLLGATNKQLTGMEVAFVVRDTNKPVYLSADMLEQIRVFMKIDRADLREYGGWRYVKVRLKQDLDNAKNFPIQSLAGHITNQGMLTTQRLFRQHNLNAWVALQVHDEILAISVEKDADKAAELLKQGMEQNIVTALIDLPMVADPVICDNLKDSK